MGGGCTALQNLGVLPLMKLMVAKPLEESGSQDGHTHLSPVGQGLENHEEQERQRMKTAEKR